ncbi:MAG: hypothetical protein OXE42_17900 [Gammaproteobacteria bacterium]|nr:hypothetical protein [Gammaproteobacteria bacterium]
MSLLTHLATIDDPRRDINKRHDLLDIDFAGEVKVTDISSSHP